MFVATQKRNIMRYREADNKKRIYKIIQLNVPETLRNRGIY
jgi:hypothetical protein